MAERRSTSEDRGTGPTSTRTAPAPEDPLATGTLEDVPVEADAEKPARVLTGRLATAVTAVAVLLSAYAVWNVFSPVPALQYRIVFLAVVLPLTFLLYRPAARRRSGRRCSTGGSPEPRCSWPSGRCSPASTRTSRAASRRSSSTSSAGCCWWRSC